MTWVNNLNILLQTSDKIVIKSMKLTLYVVFISIFVQSFCERFIKDGFINSFMTEVPTI